MKRKLQNRGNNVIKSKTKRNHLRNLVVDAHLSIRGDSLSKISKIRKE